MEAIQVIAFRRCIALDRIDSNSTTKCREPGSIKVQLNSVYQFQLGLRGFAHVMLHVIAAYNMLHVIAFIYMPALHCQ